MFKYQVSLKQHTPLIHFQNEPGATLRATELKPKLDKYLFDHVKIEKDWKIKGQEKALDYKVRIQAKDVEVIAIPKREPMPTFFGNMGDDYDLNPKCRSMARSGVTLLFGSFHEELMACIKTHVDSFFAKTNFGTRQSKGYGSFSQEGDDSKTFQNIPEIQMNKAYVNDFKDLINVINYYYQRLKSGINYRNEYQHAFLKLYLQNKGYNWEKRWLKEKFIGGLDEATNEERFARALLGLGGSYTFKPKRSDRRMGQVYPERQIDVKVESADETVARYKSPITFKPVEYPTHWSIYILTESAPAGILNADFKFSASRSRPQFLRTPSEALDISDLIKSYHEHLGDQFVAKTYTGNPSYPVKIIQS